MNFLISKKGYQQAAFFKYYIYQKGYTATFGSTKTR